ncbi:hypothetical protein GQ53DRAFT_210868 [Thozetella sp. PMI_491]|nr:hypothetical protein GQ53DRAFT_210868 [Thozetella sp. PMI_491]
MRIIQPCLASVADPEVWWAKRPKKDQKDHPRLPTPDPLRRAQAAHAGGGSKYYVAATKLGFALCTRPAVGHVNGVVNGVVPALAPLPELEASRVSRSVSSAIASWAAPDPLVGSSVANGTWERRHGLTFAIACGDRNLAKKQGWDVRRFAMWFIAALSRGDKKKTGSLSSLRCSSMSFLPRSAPPGTRWAAVTGGRGPHQYARAKPGGGCGGAHAKLAPPPPAALKGSARPARLAWADGRVFSFVKKRTASRAPATARPSSIGSREPTAYL